MNKKIVIIGCYFGKLRNDCNIWLESCRKNKDIDWIVFSDCDWKKVPPNVKIVHTEFKKIKELIQSKFDFEITLNASYKLCDYKPAYGYIFEEYIKEYDFWGYCDFDMIFGDIRKFITDEILKKYDKIYTLGHLSLYKNTIDNNRIFMSDKGKIYYKDVFSTNEIKVFDELNGIYYIFKKENKKVYRNDNDYLDLTKFSKYVINNNGNNKYKSNYKEQTVLIKNGKVYYIFKRDNNIFKIEKCYVHFSGRVYNNNNNKREFLITSSGITNCLNDDKVKIEKIPYYELTMIKEYINRKKFKIIRKIKKIKNKLIERLTI